MYTEPGITELHIHCRTAYPINWQDKSTITIISRQDFDRHSKIYHLTQPCPSGKKKLKKKQTKTKNKKTKLTSSTTTEAQVTPNKKSTQPLKQPFPLRAKTKRKKRYIPKVWERRLQME